MSDFLIAVCGATASGKTELGIRLAKRFSGEIVSCDSMQIYKGLDIGTAKPSGAELAAAPHHMIDIAEPTENYSVNRFVTEAGKAVEDILSRGKIPVLVGGTGLYMENIINRTEFTAPMRDESYSAELERFAQENGNGALFEMLRAVDPVQAGKLHENDVKRVIRSIETVHLTGKTRSELDEMSKNGKKPYKCIYFAIDMEREKLYNRINGRVDEMLRAGLLDELKSRVLPLRGQMPTAMQAIGYKELIGYTDGLCSYDEAVQLLKRNTRRYAKRQLTWLRHIENVNWLPCEDAFSQAVKITEERIKQYETAD